MGSSINETQNKTTHIEIQLARLDERFKMFETVPKQLVDMERKLDDMTKYLSSEYVRKDELDRILDERKSGFLSSQGIMIAIVNIIIAAILSFAFSKF